MVSGCGTASTSANAPTVSNSAVQTNAQGQTVSNAAAGTSGATASAGSATTAQPGGLNLTGITDGSPAAAGEQIFATAGCQSCHMIHGVGGQVGPDLSVVGTLGKTATYAGALPVHVSGVSGPTYRGANWFILHTQCPTCATPGSAMPPFASFTPAQYQELAAFLGGLGVTFK